ncbi:Do family serine endopeptidase [Paucibacter sp. R3-3]|uniref:Probable periplasmic serine endoprotease DegP-like n=1 Tax=Roseateles agri TaxID=3098619 RepID=A0ABU5DGG7_9BURK|nr:Do family serine endopeptidase [Paucibacter sp. R3-3]MDY0744237.1 Do family serine endopeptidase [Paucibacter sp. R3-3]
MPASRSLSLLLSTAVLGLGLGMASLPAAADTVTLPDFTELVERVGPAVVNIRTSEHLKIGGATGNPQIDEQMQEFLRRFGIPIPPRKGTPPRKAPGNPADPGSDDDDDDSPQRSGVASGFILSADGFVMTNAHVVADADEVFVTLTDKREFKAKIIGADERSDIAVLKIEATGLPAVKIGDVSKLKVGEWVMAIGSPFGFSNTVTAGIVSAKERDTGDLQSFIQTDVAINPGNSGGPLLNMRGEVVGVNSQIYSQSGGFMGISFAIPIDSAIRVSEQLRGSGRVVRGMLGLYPDDLSKEIAEAIGLGKPTGALVRRITADGPADKAGIEGGDVITKIDGKTVEKALDLRRLIAAIKPGSKVTLQVYRRGAYKDIGVTIGELPDERKAAAGGEEEPEGKGGAGAKPQPAAAALGLRVSDLTPAQRRELKLQGGVRIDAATDAAARAGLREGDLILALNNAEVGGVKQFLAQLAKLDKSKPVNLMVRRDDVVSFVLLRPGR